MNILIFGSDGFIGGYLKSYLCEIGHNLFGTTFIKNPLEDEIKLDVCDPSDFRKIPNRKFDVVINSTGIIDQSAPKDLMFDVNSKGTRNILDWVQKHRCRHFIQISSIAVYGFRVLGENRREDNTKRYEGKFFLPYGRSKALAENYVEKSGLNYTILRLPAVLGENDTYLSKAIVPRLLSNTFYFCGNKNRLVSTLFIKNLGPIVKKLIEIGPQNDAFNCTDHETTWRKFISQFAKELQIDLPNKKKSILSLLTNFKDKKYSLMLTFSYFGAHFPNDKLKKSINFEPKFSWQEGVRDAIKKYNL